MRPRTVLPIFLAAVLGAVLLTLPAARSRLGSLGGHTRVPTASASGAQRSGLQLAAQAAPPPPTLRAGPVTIDPRTAFFGWALLDRTTGTISGSANAGTGLNTTESMIKAWIVSDYLRTHPDAGPDVLRELRLAIIDSDDDLAQKYYRLSGGDAVIQRLISMCGLTRTTITSGWWSMTRMTPADAVRYGACVASGRAAGPRWTEWVLAAMREVRGGVADRPVNQTTGGGRWGIIDGLPAPLAQQVSLKNGWTFIWGDNLWHVNCLAILPSSVLAVMMRYSAPVNPSGLRVGAEICASVARQLVHRPDL